MITFEKIFKKSLTLSKIFLTSAFFQKIPFFGIFPRIRYVSHPPDRKHPHSLIFST